LCEILKKPIFTKHETLERNISLFFSSTISDSPAKILFTVSGDLLLSAQISVYLWSKTLLISKKNMKPVIGTVVSNKMQKSVVVAVDRLFHNKIYNRYVKRTSKFMAHDDKDACNIGDRVNSLAFPSSLSL